MTPERRAEIERAVKNALPCEVDVRQEIGDVWDNDKEHRCYGMWWVKPAIPGEWSIYVAPGGLTKVGAHWFATEREARDAAAAYSGRNPNVLSSMCRELLAALEEAERNIDIEKLTEWLRSSPRKPAALAFTSGAGRQVADLIEAAERDAVRKVVERLRLAAKNVANARTPCRDAIAQELNRNADLIEQESAK